MNFSLFNQIAILVVNIAGIWLALRVFFLDWKKKVNRYFALMVISYLCWISFYYLMRISSKESSAYFWAKMGFAGVFVFMIFLYLFSIYFLGESKKFSLLTKIIIGIGSLCVPLSLFTKIITSKIHSEKWGPNPYMPFIGKVIFFGFVIFVSVFVLFRFLKKIFNS